MRSANAWLDLSRLTRLVLRITGLALLLLACQLALFAQTRRVVILKVDGLPYEMVDRFVRERDPQTGKSQLPWFEHVFYENGTRLANFYVRGMSLSGPSWSTIDTGQHLQIKGNVEFDRDILHTYDYLNFLPFYAKQAIGGDVDMPGTEVLDSVGVPLLLDSYDNYERLPGFQLYDRGVRLKTLQHAGQNRFLKNPIVLAGEFLGGFEARDVIFDQIVRELNAALDDPRVRYLDLWQGSFDHIAHHNNDRQSHLTALRELDTLVGQVWTAIQKSPLANDTALIVVSDHGFNTDENVISQGFNLVKLLGSREGGGHHVVTKRRLLMDYSIKAINPFVPPITTASSQSYYLKGQSEAYPTALLDFDGNERAAVHLRNSSLNLLQILWQQIERRDLSPPTRKAAIDAFFSAIAREKAIHQSDLDQFELELSALHRANDKQRELCKSQPKNFSVEDREMGRDDNARRVCFQVVQWTDLEKRYRDYLATTRSLLSLEPENLATSKLKVEDVIPKGAMGPRNTIYDLQNYVVGPGRDGLVLSSDGRLDLERSFTRLDYFDLLYQQSVRNNVQQGISNRPVDFIATRIPRAAVAAALPNDLQPDDDVIWLYRGPAHQALILARGEAAGQLSLRYLPIANLTQDAQGAIHFDLIPWKSGLPLQIIEDPRLDLPVSDRAAWLSNWHTDLEWLRALHKTQYSNGLIGLHEQFTVFPTAATDVSAPDISRDERLMRGFRRRQRQLVETDLLLVANNHWNFDVRGFNPGGNHGSLFRVSTHSTLLFAGGERTGIPRGRVVLEPYDNLSVVPTVLALTGRLQSDNQPVEVLAKKGFTRFPGRVIFEVAGPGFAPAAGAVGP